MHDCVLVRLPKLDHRLLLLAAFGVAVYDKPLVAHVVFLDEDGVGREGEPHRLGECLSRVAPVVEFDVRERVDL